MSAHDRYLAGFHRYTTTAWCPKQDCANHEGYEVEIQSEHGQSWSEPEECPLCNSEWLWERPDDEENEDGDV